MDLMNMMGNMQNLMAEAKAKLDTITVDAQAGDGMIKVQANANRKLLNIEIDPSLVKDGDAEELEDLMLIAVNRVLDMAEVKAAQETQTLMSSILPPGMNLPGLF